MRSLEDLDDIIDEIRAKVMLANRTGELDELLRKLGLERFLEKTNIYDTHKDGKIVVLGGSAVKESDLIGIIKKLGLDKNRFEFCLDYDKAQTYEYAKLQYQPKYRVVIVGAVPHSSAGKGKSSSVINEMQNTEGYPKIVPLYAGNELKITKSNFQNALEELLTTRVCFIIFLLMCKELC